MPRAGERIRYTVGCKGFMRSGERKLASDFPVRGRQRDATLITLTTTEDPTMSRMHNPAHPGEVLREFLPKDLPVGEIASRLGVSRQALSALLNGRARRQRRDGPAARSCAWHQCRDVGANAGESRPLAGETARETEGAPDRRVNVLVPGRKSTCDPVPNS